KHGLRASIGNRQDTEIAFDLVKISHEGLIRRNKSNAHKTKRNEGGFLRPLFESLEKGSSLADEINEKYQTSWSYNLKHI
mgnify:CR=1